MGTEFLKIKECDEAIDIIQDLFDKNLTPQSEEIEVGEAYGRILFEDVYSRMDFPPFDKALKDGFAILAEDSFGASEESPNTLEVIDFLEAGATTDKKVEKGKCIEISTGAAMPEGSEAVVMVEYAEKLGGKVNLLTTATPSQDVAKKGSDIEEGKLILKKGDFLNPGKIGVLLSQGFETIEVYKKPTVGIVSSGNEITLQGEELEYGKIYDVNGGMIKNDAISCGADAKFLGVMRDDYDEVKQKITDSLKEVDVLFCSGGTSAGLGDVLKHVLDELGEVHIHGISVQPGKPTIVGVIDGKLVIGLPGNPVSALMIFNAFVAEPLTKLAGIQKEVDVLFCSGGTSAGLGDVLKHVLDELGEVHIHGISVQPGKPTIVGVIDGKLVIGLPGNPVSALMIFNAFVAEPLTKLAGIQKDFELKVVKGKTTRRIHSQVGRMQYQLVKVDGENVQPIFKDSGAIFSLSTADGYVKIPKLVELVDEGEEVEVYLFN